MIEPKVHPLDRWFSPGRFVLLVTCLLSACFLPVILARETFFFRDYAIFSYPLAAYHRECFWRGELPLWNPLNHCGMPFMAQWNTLVLYPFSLLYIVFPLPWSLSLFCIAHMGLAAVGMYQLARHWTASNFAGTAAGLGFIFSGVIFSCLKWPNTIAALGWMPWVVWLVERAIRGSWRLAGLAALVGSLQMLCGAPEIIALTWMFCGAIALQTFAVKRPFEWRILFRFAAIVVLVATLCAAQLLPFLEFLRESQRGEDFASSSWPMPIWGWLNFFVPLFRTFPSYHGVHAQPWQYWISTYYVSVVLSICALYGLVRSRNGRQWLTAVLTFLMLWLALGDRAWLYKWARETIPGFGTMRFPVKFVLLVAFLMPLLGAYGISRMLSAPFSKRALGVISGVFLAVILGLCLYNEFRPFPYTSAATISWNGFWRGFFMLAGTAALIATARSDSNVRHIPAILFCFIVVLDGLTHAPWQNPTAPTTIYEGTGVQMDPRPRLGAARAMISPEAMEAVDHLNLPDPAKDVGASRASLFCNLNLLEAIPKVDGFYSLYPGRTAELVDQIYQSTNRPPAGILDFLGVIQINPPGSFETWEKRAALPLIQTPKSFLVITNCLTNLLAVDFDPREIVYLETDPGLKNINQSVAIRNAVFTSHEISFAYESAGDALLVIPQTHAANWQAYLDGKSISITRANHAFQAIAGPAGAHQVLLRYEADEFLLGRIISAIGGLLLAGLVVFGKPEDPA